MIKSKTNKFKRLLRLNVVSIGGALQTVERKLFHPTKPPMMSMPSMPSMPDLDTTVGVVILAGITYYGITKTYKFSKSIWFEYSSPRWEVNIREQTRTNKPDALYSYVRDLEGKIKIETRMAVEGDSRIKLPDGHIVLRTETCNHIWGSIVRVITNNKEWGFKYSIYLPVESSTVYQHERGNLPNTTVITHKDGSMTTIVASPKENEELRTTYIPLSVLDKSKQLSTEKGPVPGYSPLPESPTISVRPGNITITLSKPNDLQTITLSKTNDFQTMLKYFPNNSETYKIIQFIEEDPHQAKKVLDELCAQPWENQAKMITSWGSLGQLEILRTIQYMETHIKPEENPNSANYARITNFVTTQCNNDQKLSFAPQINIDEEKPSTIIIVFITGLITGGITYIYRKFIKPTDSAKNNFYKKK